MRLLLTVLISLVIIKITITKTITISNLKPRTDSTGTIIDAHDGSIQQYSSGGLFYYHAVGYGLCQEPARYGCDQTADHCGFHLNHTIDVWSTPDLSQNSWKHEGQAISIDARPAGTVFRPHSIYNPNTKEHVLWWNYVTPQGQYNGYAVAASPSPVGPFKLISTQVNITRLAGGAGDFDIFVDDDGTGYVIYSANFWMSIEQLTPDFYYSTGKNASCGPNGSPLFPDYFIEAPVIFKRQNIYYALYGHCCCFCEQGSGILVYTAKNMLGPWVPQAGGDLACKDPSRYEFPDTGVQGIPTPGQGCLYNNANKVSATKAQQNYVVKVPSASQPDGYLYLWTGDRWQQAPDGIKGHEPQFWVPLEFEADGTIKPVNWVDQFDFEIDV